MFDSLQSRLGGVFDKLRGRGALTEADVDEALKEVRTALIEADVELGVVEDFIKRVRPRAEGEAVIRSVTPAQQVVKIVHDTLIETLGSESVGLQLGSPPAPILMVGLQGSGKTTTSAKLDVRLDQGGANFLQRLVDMGFGERTAPAKLVEHAAKAGLQRVEHRLPVIQSIIAPGGATRCLRAIPSRAWDRKA